MQEFEVLLLEQRGKHGKTIGYTRPSDQNKVVHLEGVSSVTQSIFGSINEILRQVFLPYGFPESVSDDYVPYQLWDTLQAFCSTITGTLATKAIMEGVGVGSSEATPLAAAVTWIFKDGTGMIGSILFAWWKGTSLDADCKKWRLVADGLNDIAFCIELSLPYFKSFSTLLLCASTAMKAVVGVAGGATRAALTQHQAIRENMADVSAKDGSQERFVNLVASLTGVFILTHIDGEFVWFLFFLLTVLHLYANYKAVRCLKMTTINNSRLILLIDNYVRRGIVAPPSKINSRESVFIGFGLSEKSVCGYQIVLGSSLKSLVLHNLIKPDNIRNLKKCFGNSKYMLIPDIPSKTLLVLLKTDATAPDIIKAYFHATLFGICLSITCNLKLAVPYNSIKSKVLERILKPASNVESLTPGQNNDLNTVIEVMLASNDVISKEFIEFYEGVQSKGWCCSSNLLHVGEWKAKWNCMIEH